MDVKAMAKSKRSHSQHHSKKSYPKPTPKATGAASAAKAEGNSKRAAGKNVVEKKPSLTRGAELPSNSDRYLDEDDLGTVDLLLDGGSLRHGADVVKPKSKGADYRYLVSEARAQAHSTTDYRDVYSSLDAILPDLNQDFGDMLSVSGEAILSWTAADYFVVEDKARPSYAASFLSLNLSALNEQLAKVDLAQRLFIEPDVLPPDLRPHKSELKDDGTEPLQNSFEIKASKADPGVADFSQPPVKDESVLKEVVVASSEVNAMNEACRSGLGLKSQVKSNISADSSKRLSCFEASQAEAELDMLLDSLGETEATLSSDTPSVQPQSLDAIQTSKPASGLDDAIDGLLSSNSNMRKNASGLDDAIDNLLCSTFSTTKTASSLDDGIDELLDATSSNLGTAVVETYQNSASSSRVKVVDEDDLDSWLETL